MKCLWFYFLGILLRTYKSYHRHCQGLSANKRFSTLLNTYGLLNIKTPFLGVKGMQPCGFSFNDTWQWQRKTSQPYLSSRHENLELTWEELQTEAPRNIPPHPAPRLGASLVWPPTASLVSLHCLYQRVTGTPLNYNSTFTGWSLAHSRLTSWDIYYTPPCCDQRYLKGWRWLT